MNVSTPSYSTHEIRYADDILRLHEQLSFGGLLDHMARARPAAVSHRHGLATICARTEDIPHRYLVGILGFRLAEYLRVGFVSKTVVRASSLFCEPVTSTHRNDWHIVTIEAATGRIVGYLSLSATTDRPGVPVLDPRRSRFDVENVHGIDVFRAVGMGAGLTTDRVVEVKRLMHRGSVADPVLKLRISLELLLGLGRVVLDSWPQIRVGIGDAESNVALRHLLIIGLDVYTVSGTEPRLAADELFHPAYVVRDKVQPFYAEAPDVAVIRQRYDYVRGVAEQQKVMAAAVGMARELRGTITRIDYQESAA